MTAGIAKMTAKATTSSAHTNMGIRFSDIPGARMRKTVTMISTATAKAETSVKVMSCAANDGSVAATNLARRIGPYQSHGFVALK